MNKYDVIIIGAGPSGIFCAYEFMRQKPDALSRSASARSVRRRSVWVVSHALSQQDLREQAHFPMENYLCHQM